MAVTAANLAAVSNSTNLSSYSTGSISPGANRLLIATVYNGVGSGTANTPTLTGNGLTWVQEETTVDFETGGTDRDKRITSFRAMGASPSAGAVTADFAGQTQSGCIIIVDEFDGVDTGGTNGSAAVVQSLSVGSLGSSASSGAVTLAAFGSASNATYGALSHVVDETSTAGSGFTKLGDVGHGAPTRSLVTEWKNSNDTSVDASWSTSAKWAGIALEIKASGGSTQTLEPVGIASAEALGTPTITVGGVTVSPVGIASAEAVGTPTILPGAITVSPVGIASQEAFGLPVVTAVGVPVNPVGIPSEEAFGLATIVMGPVTVFPVGIASAEAFGLANIAFDQILVPVGIASGEVVGTPTIALGAVTLSPVGIPSGTAFGTASVLVGPITVFPVGITSAEAFGSPSILVDQVSASLTTFLDRATSLIVKVEEDAEGASSANKGL